MVQERIAQSEEWLKVLQSSSRRHRWTLFAFNSLWSCTLLAIFGTVSPNTRAQAHTYPPPLLFSTFHRAQSTHAQGTRTYLRPQKQSHHVPMAVLTSGATTRLLQSSPSSSWPALRSVSSAHTSWTALAQCPGRRLQMLSERRRCEASRGLEMAWDSGGSRFGRSAPRRSHGCLCGQPQSARSAPKRPATAGSLRSVRGPSCSRICKSAAWHRA